MTMTRDNPKEGWAFPTRGHRQAHYFRDGKSLCGNYGISVGLSVMPDDGETRSKDCPRCTRRLGRH